MDYRSGISFGPHEIETSEVSPDGLVKRGFRNVKGALAHPHQIPSAIILIALLSFVGNIGITYVSFMNKGMEPEIKVPVAITNTLQQLGSDDASAELAPNFTPSVHFKLIDNPATLRVTAESYVVADVETGEIIMEKNADIQYPMASVSKLVTAIVAKEHIDSRHIATVSKDSYNTYGTEGELSAGEKILVTDLYYPLLIESSNDAAEVLADDFGRSDFLTLLNEKVKALGMYSTSYEDPSGLSPNNISTAHDLTKLGLYVYSSYPELLDITRVKEYSIFNHTWQNKNQFLTYPNFLGGKNGFINEAKKTTLSYFKVFFRGADTNSKAADRPIMVVLLRSNDRDKDAAAVLSYVAKNIRYVENPQE